MRHRFNLCIGVLCALSGVLAAPAAILGQSDQAPFASRSDVKLSTIRSLIEAKDHASAEKLALELCEEQPELVDAWMMLGYARTLNGRYTESNQAYDRALGYGAERAEVFRLKAYNCRRLGDAEATRRCYEEIIDADPSNVEIRTQFAVYEASIGNHEGAVLQLSEVLKITPENVDAIDAIATAEEKRENTAQVKYWLEKGQSVSAGDTRFLKRLSLVYLNEQNYTMAIHYLGKLIAADPENAGAYRNLGIAHYQQGNKKEARNAFEAVRRLGGKMDGLYGPLADCHRSTGNRAAAMEVIKEGIAAGDQKAWLYSVWGKILEDQQSYDQAIDKFELAVAQRDEPWSGYARKQIDRQTQLKKRAAMIAAQGAMD
jgi:tetratricopeptide (TPR) repeat protein